MTPPGAAARRCSSIGRTRPRCCRTPHPLLRWRMERADRLEGIYGELARFAAERRPFIDAVLARVRSGGPDGRVRCRRGSAGPADGGGGATPSAASSGCSGPATSPPPPAGPASSGSTTCRSACCPPPSWPARRPARRGAPRAAALAARALGVATAADLRDYFRLSPAIARRRSPSWSRRRDRPVAVEGWRQPAYVHRDARWPRSGGGVRPALARSTRRCGSAPGPSGCSASATGWRSTRPRTSASTATTCCPSCSATAWWRGWT